MFPSSGRKSLNKKQPETSQMCLSKEQATPSLGDFQLRGL